MIAASNLPGDRKSRVISLAWCRSLKTRTHVLCALAIGVEWDVEIQGSQVTSAFRPRM